MTRTKLSTLFYIYSELSLAVLSLIICLVELVCGFSLSAIGEKLISYLAFGFAVFFALVAVHYVLYVYSKEKGNF